MKLNLRFFRPSTDYHSCNASSLFYFQILAVLAALGTGWALGLASKKAADCLKVAGATAGGGVVAGCAAAWT